MKLFILAVVLTVLVVAEAEEKRCRKQEDCEEDECCVDWFFSGVCKPLGQEGDKCNDDFQLWGKYVHSCPCASGLECEPEEVKDLKIVTLKINQRCVAGATTAPPPDTEAPAEE